MWGILRSIFTWATFISLILWIICGFVVAYAANAEIYQWTDSSGTTNFTDDKDKIPAKYHFEIFSFDKEHKWTIDQSDTRIPNQVHLNALRKFNAHVTQIKPPQTIVIIENHWRHVKKHRAR